MMSIQSGVLPSLPRDTARATEAAFGKGHIYLTIGDQLEQLAGGIDFARLDPASEQPAATLALCALVTILQFVEGLPDRRAVEAMRTRIDWKYALHLPLAYRGLEPSTLCRFRRRLLTDRVAQQVFQQVIDGLAQTGLLKDTAEQDSRISKVLSAVCTINCLEQLVEAMQATLEALAAVDPKWLLGHTLPHWYERYNQMLIMRALPKSSAEQILLAQTIGKDAHHLLEALMASGRELAQLPEVKALQQVWHQQFRQNQSEIEWRLPVCASCAGNNQSSAKLTYASGGNNHVNTTTIS
jgi:transposase